MSTFEQLNLGSKDNPNPECKRERPMPITVCMGRRDDFDDSTSTHDFSKINQEPRTKYHDVDWKLGVEDLDSRGFANGGKLSFVISPVDGLNKLSRGFMDCTGLVVVGVDRETGHNISFLTHQTSDSLLKETATRGKFVDSLALSMNKLAQRCDKGTIDVVIVGGNAYRVNKASDIYYGRYEETINFLEGQVRKNLAIDSIVATAPAIGTEFDDIFFDNEHRRLFIERQNRENENELSVFSESVVASNIGEQKRRLNIEVSDK